jgi:hypothetical protein
MRQYVLRNKQTVPRFIVVAVASWAIALAAITLGGIAIWIISSWLHIDSLAATPRPVVVLLDICGAYAGLGSVCLWVAMWIYWIAVERSSVGVRIGWFLALLFGLHYGALFYAYRVWRTGITKMDDPNHLAGPHFLDGNRNGISN